MFSTKFRGISFEGALPRNFYLRSLPDKAHVDIFTFLSMLILLMPKQRL